MYLPVSTGVLAVDSFSSGTDLTAKFSHWASGFATMKLALGFTLNGWPTALEFCSLGHGITPGVNDPAASGG